MIKLSETEDYLVIALLHPRNYTGLHNKLTQVLTEAEVSFFARPEARGNQTVWWSVLDKNDTGLELFSYDRLTSAEQDAVADIIEDQKALLTNKLSAEAEFKDILEKLFIIPSNDDIAVLKNDHELYPVLTRWGCKLNNTLSEVDPLKMVIERPRPQRPVVTVTHQYADGEILTDQTFIYRFLDIKKTYKSNADGQKKLGRFQIGDVIRISHIDEPDNEIAFSVSENGEYLAQFPRYSPASIRIIDQDGQLLVNTDVLVTYKNETSTYNSGEEGVVQFESLEVGEKLTVAQKDDPDNQNTFTIS